jgi:hypothetical protein
MTLFYVALFTLVLGVSAGYFLAGILHWRSYRDALETIDAERDELARQRKVFDDFLDDTQEDRRVVFDLQATKSLKRVLS